MQEKIKIIVSKLEFLKDPRSLGLIAFGVIVLLVTYSGIKVAQDNYDLAKKISVQQQKNDVAKLENENLKLSNQYYQTDQYLELAARRQFGRALPGERMYMIPDDVALRFTADPPEAPKTQSNAGSTPVSKQPKFVQNINAWIDFMSK